MKQLSDTLVCQGILYHVVSSQFSHEQIGASIRDAKAILEFVGALTELPGNLVLLSGKPQEVSLADIQHMGQHAEQVFVGAYDGESFQIWCH